MLPSLSPSKLPPATCEMLALHLHRMRPLCCKWLKGPKAKAVDPNGVHAGYVSVMISQPSFSAKWRCPSLPTLFAPIDSYHTVIVNIE